MARKPAYTPTVFVSVDELKQLSGLDHYDAVDDRWLAIVVDAVNEFIREVRVDLAWTAAGTVNEFSRTDFDPQDYATSHDPGQVNQHRSNMRVRLGAVMLAQKWFNKRNSVEVAAYAEFGGPPPSIDNDIAILLGINRGFRPVVA